MSANLLKVGIWQIILFIATYSIGMFFLFESDFKSPYEEYDLLINLIFGVVFLKLSRAVTEFFAPTIIYLVYHGDFEQFNSEWKYHKMGKVENNKYPHDELKNQESPIQEFKLTIVNNPEKPLGKFLGEDFFEWVDVEDEDGNKMRLTYLGTVDPNVQTEIKRGTVIMHPGVIYSVSGQK